MIFCKNIFTQFSVGKHLSFSIVVIGSVTTFFRSVTVSGTTVFEVVCL
jgi:hypothetical protein